MDRLKPVTTTPDGPFQFALPVRVRMAETDAQSIVYHANYLAYCEAARNEYMRELELPYSQVTDAGMQMAVASATLKFHAPARFDDIIDVWTRVTVLKRVSFSFGYELRCRATNALFCTADTEIACLKSATRRPARLPANIGEAIRVFEGAHLDDRAGRRVPA